MQKGEESKLKITADALKKLESISDFKFHKMNAEAVLKHFNSNIDSGLSETEAMKRIEKHGKNELEKEEPESLWDKIKESFEDLLARILLLAATISFIIAITGDGEEGIGAYVEPFVILLILVLNALVAIY